MEVRYRPSDGRAYRASVRNLEPVEGEIFPDAHCVPALPEPEAAKAGAATSGVSARGGASKTATGAKKKSISAADPAEEQRLLGAARFVAFTDGACSGNPGPAGLGVVLLSGDSRREFSEYLGTGTNNVAELTAILRALEAVERTGESTHVHTDSQYAIGVLQKGWKAKANQALIAEIKERMKAFKALKLVYVPGHAGVPLNERADELARMAVSSRSTSGWREVLVARTPAVESQG